MQLNVLNVSKGVNTKTEAIDAVNDALMFSMIFILFKIYFYYFYKV